MEKKLTILSKTISHALRHEPWLYELELDDEGWASLEALLAILREKNKEWSGVSESTVRQILAGSTKRRFEIKDGKIRALYGHSTLKKLLKQSKVPPESLYHGTTPKNLALIQQQGLKPMNRQYVHLSADIETAKLVGFRKSKEPTILTIKSLLAHKAGIEFYYSSDNTWLCDYIPPKYIQYD